MDSGGLQCHGCGSTNVEFDPKNRKLICNTCGKEEYYSRATLNTNGKVVFSRQNAIQFFMDGRFEDSRHYAMEVLNILADNAPALYIMAYYEEFVTKNDGALKRFFNQMQEVALEYDEVQDLRKLLVASSYRLQDYEEDMIQLIAANMQSEEDKDELCGFIDQICPYLIPVCVSKQENGDPIVSGFSLKFFPGFPVYKCNFQITSQNFRNLPKF